MQTICSNLLWNSQILLTWSSVISHVTLVLYGAFCSRVFKPRNGTTWMSSLSQQYQSQIISLQLVCKSSRNRHQCLTFMAHVIKTTILPSIHYWWKYVHWNTQNRQHDATPFHLHENIIKQVQWKKYFTKNYSLQKLEFKEKDILFIKT